LPHRHVPLTHDTLDTLTPTPDAGGVHSRGADSEIHRVGKETNDIETTNTTMANEATDEDTKEDTNEDTSNETNKANKANHKDAANERVRYSKVSIYYDSVLCMTANYVLARRRSKPQYHHVLSRHVMYLARPRRGQVDRYAMWMSPIRTQLLTMFSTHVFYPAHPADVETKALQ
jgi:cobalamin biosynthesis protein CobT